MLKFYFDSGTTNTRLYVIDEKGDVIQIMEKSIGSKDVSLSCDKNLLARELSAMYFEAKDKLQYKYKNINDMNDVIWMSGMITSANGIVEIPHIGVPVGKKKLASCVQKFYEEKFFKKDIYFIPGIKSVPDGTEITVENVYKINNMRGEETEIIGILEEKIPDIHHDSKTLTSDSEKSDTFVLIMPGSHTQIAVVKDGEITDIISTITGELFKALKSQTILASSLEETSEKSSNPDSKVDANNLDLNMVETGAKNLEAFGFNRAIYIVRSLLLFTDSSVEQRKSYLEGVLNGGVLKAIKAVLGSAPLNIYVCGNENQFKIIRTIAEKIYPEYRVSFIENNKSMPFSVLGFKAIYACSET